MSDRPQVTFVVPCLDSESTLDETLESIRAQTIRAWECVVINDGSSDYTGAIAQAWAQRDPRFRLLSQANAGLSSARNRGLGQARGDYLLFLDSDDLIGPRKIESHLNIAGPPGNKLVYGGCKYFLNQKPYVFTNGKDGSDHVWMPRLSGTPREILPKLAEANIMVVSCPLVPAALARSVGGFDPELTSFEDWEFWIRCARAGAVFAYDPEPQAETLVRLTEHSMSADGPRMFANELRVRLKHADVPEMQAAFKARRRFHLKAAVADLLQGKWRSAARRVKYAVPATCRGRVGLSRGPEQEPPYPQSTG